jgi:basic membrane protein A
MISVCVLIPGFPQDGGYMESAADGVKKATADLKGRIKIKTISPSPSADMLQVLTTLASQSDLVVSVGGQTDSALGQVIQSFPSKKLVAVGGPSTPAANLAASDPKQARIAFVAGALAALTSKTGKVQFLAGLEILPIVTAANEFAMGARYAKPSIIVVPSAYTGDFEDVSKAKEAVLAGIASGVEVQYQILNTVAIGAVIAGAWIGLARRGRVPDLWCPKRAAGSRCRSSG